MKKFNDSVYLQHILDAIQKISLYLQEIDKDKFLKNSLIQDGVIRQLEIIGEATKQIHRNYGINNRQFLGVKWQA